MHFLHFSIFASRLFFCRRVISVSRLDRETSGVLVAATCQEGADALTEQFKEHRVFKRYLALCTGRVEPPEGKGGWSVFWFLWMDSHFVKLICFLNVVFEEQLTKLKIIRCLHTEANTLLRQVKEATHTKTWRCRGDQCETLHLWLCWKIPSFWAKDFLDTFGRSKGIGILHRSLAVIWIYTVFIFIYITWQSFFGTD